VQFMPPEQAGEHVADFLRHAQLPLAGAGSREAGGRSA